MKLAEALIQRADYEKRIAQLNHRLTRSARVQEGDTPADNPQELLAELETVIAQLIDVGQRVNRTNATVEVEEGKTIVAALVEKEALLKRWRVYEAVVNAAIYRVDRYSRTEIRSHSTVNIAELQTQMDQLSRQIRELDMQLQQINWTVDVME